jgi:hypothetical protein
MNELQRQQYLSALGVDSYMPRVHLPFAPVSVACHFPVEILETKASDATASVETSAIMHSNSSPSSSTGTNSPANLIGDFLEPKRAAKPVTSAADILASLETKPAKTIAPFTLSIWRPLDGLLVIDARNSKLALPTEQFLKNMLRALYPHQPLQLQEEVLRWPMIENSFAKRTLADARNELQTWLAVQCEIRSVNHIWLMGQNAAAYLLSEQDAFADLLFQEASLAEVNRTALLLPSLNELLQQTGSKPALFKALRRYHKPQQ